MHYFISQIKKAQDYKSGKTKVESYLLFIRWFIADHHLILFLAKFQGIILNPFDMSTSKA